MAKQDCIRHPFSGGSSVPCQDQKSLGTEQAQSLPEWPSSPAQLPDPHLFRGSPKSSEWQVPNQWGCSHKGTQGREDRATTAELGPHGPVQTEECNTGNPEALGLVTTVLGLS